MTTNVNNEGSVPLLAFMAGGAVVALVLGVLFYNGAFANMGPARSTTIKIETPSLPTLNK